MSLAARPLLRARAGQTLRQALGRRFESSAAGKAEEAASKAKDEAASKAKDYQARAQQGLSRVTSAAGPALAGAARGVTGALGRIGGRTGRLIAFVEKQTPLVIYYARVSLEVAKLVARGQKMSPPSIATFQTYYQSLWKGIQTRSFLRSPQNLIGQARNVSNAQLAAGGVVLAECLGFFTVGEMLGRFKLVGYRGETSSH